MVIKIDGKAEIKSEKRSVGGGTVLGRWSEKGSVTN